MRTNTSTSSSSPEKLHTIPEVALAMGCHPVSLYKAANGQLDMPAPKTIRIGRLLRVRDCDFQSFLDGLSSIKEPAKARDQDGAEQTPQPAKKRLGRPTKAAQLARREAASRASAIGSAA